MHTTLKHVRCAAHSENLELRLIQTHIPKGQASEQAGEQDQNRYEDDEDGFLGAMELLAFGECVETWLSNAVVSSEVFVCETRHSRRNGYY